MFPGSSVDAQGRRQATRVRFAGSGQRRLPGRNNSVVYALAIAGLFLCGMAILMVAGMLPFWLCALYFGASFVAFVVYAWDKMAARGGRSRTPEKSLHLLGLIGGWPGALVARQVFRHKSKKQPFIIVFWGTVAVNVIVLMWLLSPKGRSVLESILQLT